MSFEGYRLDVGLRWCARVLIPLLTCVFASAACSDSHADDPTTLDGKDAGRADGSDLFDNSSSSSSDSDSTSGQDDSSDGEEDNEDGDGDDAVSGGSTDGSTDGSTSGSTTQQGYVPQFPGAGTATDTAPLQGGELCDSVSGDAPPVPPTVTRCFYGPEDSMNPAATIEQALECVDGTNTLHLRLTFDPNFNDNTYGTGSIGWSPVRGHWFSDLVGSDHAELKLVDGNGEVSMQFKLDYISADSSAPSGYATLGVSGGDGSVTIGDAAYITAYSTSLDKNLNERGYSEYTVDSPATDESYTPNPDAPEWDYRMVFEAWIDLDAFGNIGFSGAFIDYVHASPSKDDNETIDVKPEECPPPRCELENGCDADNPCYDGNPDTFCDRGDPCYDSDPDTVCDPDDPCADGDPDTFCDTGDPCYDGDPDTVCDDPCADNDPDTFCDTGDPAEEDEPTREDPAFCDLYPTDPTCHVD